jgi:hypothetical protein
MAGRGPQKRRVDSNAVFINMPFDEQSEPVFLGYLAGLVSLGLKPCSVLEVPETGEGRLMRLFDRLAACASSIHNLSRVELDDDGYPRFNMPFELGIAYALHRLKKHKYVVYDSQPYRLQRTLSDLNLIDPFIHDATAPQALGAIYHNFRLQNAQAPHSVGQQILDSLSAKVGEVKSAQGTGGTLFSREAFHQLIRLAVEASDLPLR